MHLENHKAKNLSYEQEVTAKGMFKYIITPNRGGGVNDQGMKGVRQKGSGQGGGMWQLNLR